MREKQLTRRATLRLLVAAPMAASVLSACGKKTEPDSCQDVSALSDAEKTGRSALQYTDKSPQADKLCSACNFWQPPTDPAQCGGCQLVKGPIHPKGYCTAFAAKVAS
jgi:hypothetical protein